MPRSWFCSVLLRLARWRWSRLELRRVEDTIAPTRNQDFAKFPCCEMTVRRLQDIFQVGTLHHRPWKLDLGIDIHINKGGHHVLTSAHHLYSTLKNRY
jgi:hypothetical protein